MKIEIDDNCVWAIGYLSTAAVLLGLIICIYKYNVTPLQHGYSEVQQSGSQSTMWVAPTNKQ